MSTVTRKMDRLYEVRGTLRLMASPLVWTAKVYVQGLRTLIPLARRVGFTLRRIRRITVVPTPRPRRSSDVLALARARDLFVAARPFVDIIKRLGVSDSDSTLLAHVRATALAMASQGFENIYDNALDSLTGESEQDLYVRIVLEMQQAEVASL